MNNAAIAWCLLPLTACFAQWDWREPPPRESLTQHLKGKAPEIRTRSAVEDSIVRYRKNDLELDELLRQSWHAMSRESRRKYAAELSRTLKSNPRTSFDKKTMLRLGEVYFSLRDYHNAIRWYTRAVRADSTLYRTTVAGYRLEVARERRTFELVRAGCYMVYGLAAFFLLMLAVKARGRCNTRLLARGGLYIAASVVLLSAVLAVDGLLSPDDARSLAENDATGHHVIVPVIPFTVFDSLPVFGILMAAALLPVLFSFLCLSFCGAVPRWVVAAVSCVLGIAVWTHCVISTHSIENGPLLPWGIVTPARIYFLGEPEDIILNNPWKVLRAAPDAFTTDNSDLGIFMKEHFPDGIPERKKR